MTDLYMYRSSLLLVQNSNINVVKMIDCEIIKNHTEMRINIIIYSTLNNSIGLFLSKHPCIVHNCCLQPLGKYMQVPSLSLLDQNGS